MKAHSLGSVALYGNAGQSREGGVFSKMNTFGNLGAPRAVKVQRARNTQSTALVAKADQFEDDFYLPDEAPAEEESLSPPHLNKEQAMLMGLGNVAYFGSDPSFVRREGGVMASSTTFGNFAGPPASIPHSRYVAGGSIGTLAALVVAYYGAKKLKLL